MVRLSTEGQIQTVEAIASAILLISVLALVVDATSVTPLTSSFTNQHVKLELQNLGTDILSSMDETQYSSTIPADPMMPSQLKKSVTEWINNTAGRDWFANKDTKTYVSLLNPANPPINTDLSRTLSTVLLDRSGIVYNVEVRYSNAAGNIKNTKMIWNGDPSDNSVTVSRFVTLHDEDIGNSDCIIPDISKDSDWDPDTNQYLHKNTNLYNVVEVRLTMWVM